MFEFIIIILLLSKVIIFVVEDRSVSEGMLIPVKIEFKFPLEPKESPLVEKVVIVYVARE